MPPCCHPGPPLPPDAAPTADAGASASTGIDIHGRRRAGAKPAAAAIAHVVGAGPARATQAAAAAARVAIVDVVAAPSPPSARSLENVTPLRITLPPEATASAAQTGALRRPDWARRRRRRLGPSCCSARDVDGDDALNTPSAHARYCCRWIVKPPPLIVSEPPAPKIDHVQIGVQRERRSDRDHVPPSWSRRASRGWC